MRDRSAILRFHVRNSLRGHWQTVLLAAFTAGFCRTLYQVAFDLKSGELLTRYAELMAGHITLDGFIGLLKWSDYVIPLALFALSLIVTPALNMGLIQMYILLVKGMDAPFNTIFSRLRVFHKAIALNIYTGLKMILWGLLPMIPFTGWLLLGFPLDVPLFIGILRIMPVASVILVFMAYYRYVLAVYILTEYSDNGVFYAVITSKKKMRGYKKDFIMLQLSFVGWLALSLVLHSILPVIVGNVIAIAAGLFIDLALSVYMSATITMFYLARWNTPAVKNDEKPEA